MLDFFTSKKDGKQDYSVISNALMSGLGNLFKMFTSSSSHKNSTHHSKETTVGFIPKFAGAFVEVATKFTKALFGNSSDPLVQEVVKKVDDVGQSFVNILKSDNPIEALVRESAYQKMSPETDLYAGGLMGLFNMFTKPSYSKTPYNPVATPVDYSYYNKSKNKP